MRAKKCLQISCNILTNNGNVNFNITVINKNLNQTDINSLWRHYVNYLDNYFQLQK